MGEPVEVFKSQKDPDYQIILAMIEAGKTRQDQVKRFSMPGFKPRPEYIRQMKRYGVLPDSFDAEQQPVNVYELDQKYWESKWHIPSKRP